MGWEKIWISENKRNQKTAICCQNLRMQLMHNGDCFCSWGLEVKMLRKVSLKYYLAASKITTLKSAAKEIRKLTQKITIRTWNRIQIDVDIWKFRVVVQDQMELGKGKVGRKNKAFGAEVFGKSKSVADELLEYKIFMGCVNDTSGWCVAICLCICTASFNCSLSRLWLNKNYQI